MARTFDAIVIGAGVIGASIAFHLTRAGLGRVGIVERLRSLGVETSALGPDELRDVMPALHTPGVAAGAYEPTSGYADPIATTRSLVAAAVASGAELIQRTPVGWLSVSGGPVGRGGSQGGRLG